MCIERSEINAVFNRYYPIKENQRQYDVGNHHFISKEDRMDTRIYETLFAIESEGFIGIKDIRAKGEEVLLDITEQEDKKKENKSHDELSFDETTGEVKTRNKLIERLNKSDIQYYVFKAVFAEEKGNPVRYLPILDELEADGIVQAGCLRQVYDSVLNINKRYKEKHGIKQVFDCKNGDVTRLL